MQAFIRLPLYVLAVGLLTSCTAPARAPASGVKTYFVPEAVLSRSELEGIIALAHSCGISTVAEVHSYNVHPTSGYEFRVKGVDCAVGRQVSYVQLTVQHRKWDSPTGPADVKHSIGKLWMQAGSMRTNMITTFAVPGGTARVELDPRVELAVADRIVSALADGRITYNEPSHMRTLGKINLLHLVGLSLLHDGPTYVITLDRGATSWMIVHLTTERDAVRIVNVGRAVS